MSRVINMKSAIKNFLTIIFLFFSFSISANDILEIEVYVSANSSNINKIKDLNRTSNIYLREIFNNKNIIVSSNPQENFNKNLESNSPRAQFVLNKNEFVQIQGVDGIKKLFNGSIIVKFKSVPNLQNYAINNELELILDLSNIQRGIFKVNNLYDLQSVIDNIQSDLNILEVELQTFDTRTQLE